MLPIVSPDDKVEFGIVEIGLFPGFDQVHVARSSMMTNGSHPQGAKSGSKSNEQKKLSGKATAKAASKTPKR